MTLCFRVLFAFAFTLLLIVSGCRMSKPKSRWRTTTSAPLTSRMVLTRAGVAIIDRGDKQEGRLSCYSLTDGEAAWHTSFDDLGLKGDDVLTVGSDPAGETIYVAHTFNVAAYAADSGKKLWSAEVPNPTFHYEDFTASPTPVVSGERLLLSSRRSRAVALDLKSGQLLWRADPASRADSLVVRGDTVVTLAYEGNEVRAYDLATGKERWSRTMSGPFQISQRQLTSIRLSESSPDIFPVVDADKALLGIDVATGKERWSDRIVGLVSFVLTGSQLVVSDSATVRAITLPSGAVSWRNPTGGLTLLAPLDAKTGLLQLPRSTARIDYASGGITELARNVIIEQDRVLDARDGKAALTASGTAHLYYPVGDRIAEAQLGESQPRPGNPAAHGILQVILSGDNVLGFSTSHEIELLQIPR